MQMTRRSAFQRIEPPDLVFRPLPDALNPSIHFTDSRLYSRRIPKGQRDEVIGVHMVLEPDAKGTSSA
jgi:hypothetical protein